MHSQLSISACAMLEGSSNWGLNIFLRQWIALYWTGPFVCHYSTETTVWQWFMHSLHYNRYPKYCSDHLEHRRGLLRLNTDTTYKRDMVSWERLWYQLPLDSKEWPCSYIDKDLNSSWNMPNFIVSALNIISFNPGKMFKKNTIYFFTLGGRKLGTQKLFPTVIWDLPDPRLILLCQSYFSQ